MWSQGFQREPPLGQHSLCQCGGLSPSPLCPLGQDPPRHHSPHGPWQLCSYTLGSEAHLLKNLQTCTSHLQWHVCLACTSSATRESPWALSPRDCVYNNCFLSGFRESAAWAWIPELSLRQSVTLDKSLYPLGPSYLQPFNKYSWHSHRSAETGWSMHGGSDVLEVKSCHWRYSISEFSKSRAGESWENNLVEIPNWNMNALWPSNSLLMYIP